MIREAFDFDKEYGIVLEGGGAKGAYQIGAWKAFLECRVKIKGVAGVSVGALNGALICMGDYEKAVEIWKNISYSAIMKVDDIQMEKLMNKKFMELNLQTVRKESKRFIVGGGIDVTPLKHLIEETVDEKKVKESEIEFIMGTFSVNNMKELDITAKEAEEGYLKDYLMASAYFPFFKNEKLHGKTYLDGGIVNNIPIDMLINRGYKDIIVIRIYGIGVEKRVKIPEGVNVKYFAPKRNLCNIMEFNKKKAARNITIGYYDALKILRSLAGNDYYIATQKCEKEYLDSLLQLEEETISKLFIFYKQDSTTWGLSIRILVEAIYPQIAATFKLGKKWDYGDLYMTLLEYSAKKLRIPKFKIYTEKDFCLLLKEKLESYHMEGKTDIFMELALGLIKNQF